jgi:hypothetical protein
MPERFNQQNVFHQLRRIVEEALEPISQTLNRMERLLMDITEALADIDTATTALGTRVTDLVNSVAAGQTLTPAQQTEHDNIVAALTGMAKSPATPVPVIPPVPPAL